MKRRAARLHLLLGARPDPTIGPSVFASQARGSTAWNPAKIMLSARPFTLNPSKRKPFYRA